MRTLLVSDEESEAQHERYSAPIPSELEWIFENVQSLAALAPATQRQVAMCIRRESFPAGSVLIEQGTLGLRLFAIHEGEVGIIIAQPDGTEKTVATLGARSCVGERALLGAETTNATVRTTRPTVAFVIHRETFVVVWSEWVFKKVRALAALPAEQQRTLASLMEIRQIRPGEVLVHEGKPNPTFFAIQKGEVRVSVRRDDGSDEEVARLGPGACIGERSLEGAETASATVPARSP